MSTQRNLSIESLRGIAILLVVIGHVIGSAPDGGMKIDYPHLLRYLYVWIDYIQMPLFTAIAGWVYALKPFSASSSWNEFVLKKALRLLVPMAVVGTIYFLVQYIMPGTNNKGDFGQLWRIYIYPYTIYWYLPSLFLMLMIQALIDRKGWMKKQHQWMILCFIAIVLSQTNDMGIMHDIPNLFSFKGALGQLPYFFVGVAANRFSFIFQEWIGKRLAGVSIIAGITLIQLVWFYPGEVAAVCRVLYPITLIPILFLLLSQNWHNPFFTWVGGYAYSIYLFHGFGTSGGRIILKMLGVKAVASIFVFSTVIASTCPIIVDKLASRFKWGKILLLGKK